jgi:Holliday junction resolvase RusA-like endonuclease
MERLILPLQMWGKLRNHWHEKGQPVRRKVQVGEKVYKTGKKKGQKYPVYDWVIDLKKQKVKIGEREITRGAKKGQTIPVFETKLLPHESTGYFPSANAIFINNNSGRGGGMKRLNPMAEDKLKEWKELSEQWVKRNKWTKQDVGVKVVANMVFYLPDEKMRDTHNAKKLLLDALEGVIHENDMWILDRTIDFHFDADNPRIEIDFSIL